MINLTTLKKMMQDNKIVRWVEAGMDVLWYGDALLGNQEKSRLDYYQEHGGLNIYDNEDEWLATNYNRWVACGDIVFENGKKVIYDIMKKEQD